MYINHLSDWIHALHYTNNPVNPNPQQTLFLFTSWWIIPLFSSRFASRRSVPFTYQRAGGLEYLSSLYATRDELHCISRIIPYVCYEEPVELGHNEWEIYRFHDKGFKPTNSSHIHHINTTAMDESVSGRNGWTLTTQTPSTVALNELLIGVQSNIIHLILKPTLHHQNITANAHLIEPIPLISLHTILSCSPSCESCKSPQQSYPDFHSIHLTNTYPWNHSPHQAQHSPTKRFNETILLKTRSLLSSTAPR